MTSSIVVIDIIGAALLLWSIISYLFVVVSQYRKLKQSTSRLQVLATRATACVPLYASVIYITLLAPSAYNGLQIPIAVFEGYSFYCFFTLLLTNLGGPNAALSVLQKTEKPLFCGCCCPSDKKVFFGRLRWALFNFLTTRVLVVIFTVVAERNRLAYILLTLVALALLVWAVLSTVMFFENVYEHCTNLMAITKFIVIKCSVGLLVVQGTIVQIIIALNDEFVTDDDTFSKEDKTIRTYTLILLIEYFFVSIIMMVAFSSEIKPSVSIGNQSSSDSPLEWSFCRYVYELVQLQDVLGSSQMKEEEDLKTSKAEPFV